MEITATHRVHGGALSYVRHESSSVGGPMKFSVFLPPGDGPHPVLIWLCSTRSDGATGWRYNGSLWDASVDPDVAAAGCRENPSITGAARP